MNKKFYAELHNVIAKLDPSSDRDVTITIRQNRLVGKGVRVEREVVANFAHNWSKEGEWVVDSLVETISAVGPDDEAPQVVSEVVCDGPDAVTEFLNQA